jgi:putative oxidoreductase
MKTAIVVARVLLGLIFFVFGLNGFLHFVPQPPPPPPALAFFGALGATGYMIPLLFTTQVVGGALLLLGVVPLALVLLAPVIVNIVLFHLFLAPEGLPLAVVVAALELFLAWAHRDAFAPLFATGARDRSVAARRRAA